MALYLACLSTGATVAEVWGKDGFVGVLKKTAFGAEVAAACKFRALKH